MLKQDSSDYAFPTTADNIPSAGSKGMSLRDYFAGQALAGCMADSRVKVEGSSDARLVAKKCYALADQMLKVRAEG